MNEPGRKRAQPARKAVAIAGAGAVNASVYGAVFPLLGARLRAALAEESEQGRLAPWLAAGFCGGVLLYFVAPAEPSWLAALGFLIATLWLGYAVRGRVVVFAAAALLAASAAGFATGSIRGAMIAHSVLTAATSTVTLQGFVEARDATTRSDRIVLRVTKRDPQLK